MSWSDDEWGKPIFPTRFGSPQGHATERKMLDAVNTVDSVASVVATSRVFGGHVVTESDVVFAITTKA